VSWFNRDGDELDVQVFWRLARPQPGWSKAELRRQAPQREELCPVPFVQFREDFLKNERVAYRFDALGQDNRASGKGRGSRRRPTASSPARSTGSRPTKAGTTPTSAGPMTAGMWYRKCLSTRGRTSRKPGDWLRRRGVVGRATTNDSRTHRGRCCGSRHPVPDRRPEPTASADRR
jgi:hypothetical protein